MRRLVDLGAPIPSRALCKPVTRSRYRMFCYITENCGSPPASREVVVNLIGHTTTQTGFGDPIRVVGRCRLPHGSHCQ